MAIVGKEYCDAEERLLTVRKTSHFSPGDGFAAYDHRTGGLAFRADTYGRGHGGGASSPGELALLGPAGEPLLTVRRRRPSLHQRWEGFLGSRAEGQKPLFSARRSSILGGAAAGAVVELLSPAVVPSSVAAPVLLRVDGSFPRRCCRVVAVASSRGVDDGEKEKVVAEIRRKVPRWTSGRGWSWAGTSSCYGSALASTPRSPWGSCSCSTRSPETRLALMPPDRTSSSTPPSPRFDDDGI